MSARSSLNGFHGLPDLRVLGPSHFPLIVVKLGPSFQMEPVAVRTGPHGAQIACGRCEVQVPEPFDADGNLSANARLLLVEAVQQAVRAYRHRMCIVWSGERCSYVETDCVNESTSLPNGGVCTPLPIRFEERQLRDTGQLRRGDLIRIAHPDVSSNAAKEEMKHDHQ
jgi:hypothetical protein